jgi:hypothetical protein
MSAVEFFSLDIFMRRADSPDPQSVAEATGLTIICDEDAAAVGAECWPATLAGPKEAAEHYASIGGTVSMIYSRSQSA